MTWANLIDRSLACRMQSRERDPPPPGSAATHVHMHTKRSCPYCSAVSAPAATAADKLGRLIASQKLFATLGISGPVGAFWGGLSHTEPPHAITLLLMRCGIFRGASRLPGWRHIIGTSAAAACIWPCPGHMMRCERLAGLIKVKTPVGLSHIYSITLTELISQTVSVL